MSHLVYVTPVTKVDILSGILCSFQLTHKVISVWDEHVDSGGLVRDDFGADGGSAEVHLAALGLVDRYGRDLTEYLRLNLVK